MENNDVVNNQQEFDAVENFLCKMAVERLGISQRTAKLRIKAIVKSGILTEFGKPDSPPFQIAIDCAMRIPQLGEKED